MDNKFPPGTRVVVDGQRSGLVVNWAGEGARRVLFDDTKRREVIPAERLAYEPVPGQKDAEESEQNTGRLVPHHGSGPDNT